MLKPYVLSILLTATLSATVYDIHTQSLWGRVSAEAGDTLILHPNHPLVGHTPKHINIIICTTIQCRAKHIKLLKYKYHTRGITIEEIK